MMTALEKRYQVAIDKIGHARLLNLPEQIKELLKNTKDLKTKTELLEEIPKIFSRNRRVAVCGNCPTCTDETGHKTKDG